MMVVLLSSTGALAAPSTGELLATMDAAHGDAYVAARTAVVASASLDAIEARRRASRYDQESWRSDVHVDVAHLYMTRPAAAARAYQLEGLDPAKYGRRRRPEPEVARELARLDAAPVLFELLLEGGPANAVSEAEKRALLEGVIVALGSSKHPAAHWALRETALRDARVSVRALAARALGLTGRIEAEATLTLLLRDPAIDVRVGTMQGLGQVRTTASVEALRSMLDAETKDERTVAIRALAVAGSRRALRGSPDAEAIGRAVSASLLAMVRSARAAEHGDALVEAIAVAGDTQTLADLRALSVEGEAQRSIVARAIRRLERRT
jgi:HEAT repeat protein